jgi:peptide subunit release factor 1 (eRF1)
MADNTTGSASIRRLAEMRSSGAKILSLYLNLDPSVFPTPQSRRTEVDSLLGDAERRFLKAADGLTHEQKVALRDDLAGVRDYFEAEHYTVEGAHGLALFCSGPNSLFEVVRLSRPVASEVVVNDSPYIEPLHEAMSSDGWCVFLVNRRTGRILLGIPERLEEAEEVRDLVHGWHEQGGWSQARYQRGIEKEIQDHVKHACEVLFELFKERQFRHLMVGSPKELWPEVEATLHPYLRECLAGRIDVDVEHASLDEIRRVAQAVAASYEKEREADVLERVREGMGSSGRAVAGLEPVLAALNERRVEIFLQAKGFRAKGVVCPSDGWAGVSGSRCPLDGTKLERRDDILERALELALGQSAEALAVRHQDEQIRELGGVAAILRF